MTNGRSPTELDDRAADDEAAIANFEEPAGHTPTDAEYSVAFSPRQVAGGFAILAALLVLLFRRRRGRKKG